MRRRFKTRSSISAKYCKENNNNPIIRIIFLPGSDVVLWDHQMTPDHLYQYYIPATPQHHDLACLCFSSALWPMLHHCPVSGHGAKLEAWPLSSLPAFCHQHSSVPLCTIDLLLTAPSLSTPCCFLLFTHRSVTLDRFSSLG